MEVERGTNSCKNWREGIAKDDDRIGLDSKLSEVRIATLYFRDQCTTASK